MSKLVPFEQAAVPAHIAAMQGGANTDLTQGVNSSYPIISYKGKVWHVNEGDNSTLVADEESGDPKASIEVVLLKANPKLSKIYYEAGYEEGSTAKPDCYSNDSITPALDAQTPQHTTCGGCPHNAWGSRITDAGGKGKECGDSRRMAVAPVGELDRPMLLRVPAASLKELTEFGKTLDKRSAPYSAVVTKVGFDHEVAFPKLTFKALRWLDEEEVEKVAAIDNQLLENICALNSASAPAAEPIAGTRPANAPKADSTALKTDTKKATIKKTEPAKAKPVEPEPEAVPEGVMAQADDALNAALAMLDDE